MLGIVTAPSPAGRSFQCAGQTNMTSCSPRPVVTVAFLVAGSGSGSGEAVLAGFGEVGPPFLRRLDLDALRLDAGLHGLLDGGR